MPFSKIVKVKFQSIFGHVTFLFKALVHHRRGGGGVLLGESVFILMEK